MKTKKRNKATIDELVRQLRYQLDILPQNLLFDFSITKGDMAKVVGDVDDSVRRVIKTFIRPILDELDMRLDEKARLMSAIGRDKNIWEDQR